MAREAWTDQRLDDLNERIAGLERRVETGFASMQAEFKSVREEMHAGFQGIREEMNTGFKSVREEMNAGFKEGAAESVSIRRDMADQLSAQNRMIMQLAGGMFGTMIVGFLGTIATIIVTA